MERALAPGGSDELEIAEQSLLREQARLGQARSALLPSLSASLTEENQRLNLAAEGLAIPGLAETGSFNTFDARLSLNENLFDLAAFQRWRAARRGVVAARGQLERGKDEIAAQVARLYVAALRAEALADAAEENVRRAQALLDLAEHREAVGKGTRLDAARARSALAGEQERLLSARIEQSRARLGLLRVLRVDLDMPVSLGELPSAETRDVSLEEALATALQNRRDLSAQAEREEAARLGDAAARSERWPSLIGFADYGPSGLSPAQAINTHLEGVSLRLPLFSGGSLAARRAAAEVEWRIERVRSGNLRRLVEFDLRSALETLRLAKERLAAAGEALTLAQDELAQAQRRYEAGVAGNVEVTEAQTRLSRARERRAEASFGLQDSRLDLWLAMGVIRPMIRGENP